MLRPVDTVARLGGDEFALILPGIDTEAEAGVLADRILASLRERARQEPVLVQERVQNHPAMADLSNGALATVRIVTLLDERGDFEPTHAVLRMAVGSNITVDNFHAGGIAAAVDLTTGILGPASDMGVRPQRGWYVNHPDTGGRIDGRALPCWTETLALVQRAHAAFGDRLLIGWDVALTPHGPLLMEGNAAPDVDILQRACRAPLGDSRFAALLMYHVQRARAVRAGRAQAN